MSKRFSTKKGESVSVSEEDVGPSLRVWVDPNKHLNEVTGAVTIGLDYHLGVGSDAELYGSAGRIHCYPKTPEAESNMELLLPTAEDTLGALHARCLDGATLPEAAE